MGVDSSYKNLMIFFIGFLVMGLLYVLLRNVAFTAAISQFLSGTLVVLWGVSIYGRIINKRVRRLFLAMAGLMLLYSLLQLGRYIFFGEEYQILRLLWYAYYIPMTGIPLCLFYVSLYMNLPENEVPDRRWRMLFIPAVLFVLGFLTNDVHQLAFYFPPGYVNDAAEVGRGIFYWSFWTSAVGLLVAAFTIMLHKCRLVVTHKQFLLPILPLLLGGAWLLSYALGMRIELLGGSLWHVGEVFCFSIICFIEACISIGMIPANTGYGVCFKLMDVPAWIEDTSGKVIYQTHHVENGLKENEGTRIETHAISGGSVSWAVDLTALNILNRALGETTEQIHSRNVYLKTQNALQEEQAAVEARSRVYDRISSVIKPQMDKIEMILKHSQADTFTQDLAKITVYEVYIKRRSNMELLRSQQAFISETELAIALQESAEYLKLCGVEVVVNVFGEGELISDAVILAYTIFEAMIEEALFSLRALSIVLSVQDGVLSLRLSLNADDLTFDTMVFNDDLGAFGGTLHLEKEGSDVLVHLTLKGGAYQ